jgi:iron complex outermembrane receptor protein
MGESLLRRAIVELMAVGLVLGATALDAQTTGPRASVQDLKRLSIEELADLDVTTVSRRVERLSDTAAAISVVRQDDIRRSGVTTLADAMRLADALDVGRINSSTWGVTARGFNTNPANKMLVLIDGRSVYSPLSSGTFWDVQDVLLGDIDRIEVIRGPGGSVWGANAVNGVINVITKDASATRGDLVAITAGTDEHVIASARHGGRLGGAGSYRVYGKFRQRGPQVFPSGASAHDEVALGQAGFVLDSGEAAASHWRLQGDLYRGSTGFPDRSDGEVSGGNVLGRWTRRFSSTAQFEAQAYFDRTYRKVPLQFEETRNTVDLDTQHRMILASRHDVVVGGGFRVTSGDDLGVAGFFFDPRRRTSALVSVFAQDEITLRPRQVFVTLGSKFERNDFTGLEAQPTARVRWTPGTRQTVWGAVSRAVRLPTRFDTDLRLINPATGAITVTGSEDFKAEHVVAYEGGYRVRPASRLAVDVALFTNRYDDLRSTELTFTPAPLVVLKNFLNARTSGAELAGTVQPLPPWRIHASYAYLTKTFTFDPGSHDVYGGAVEANDPGHLFSLRSFTDLSHGFALDVMFRSSSARPQPAVAAYAELDLRLGWMVRPGWELSLVGQNLLHDHHPEMANVGAPRYEFRRGVYVRNVWRF